MIVQVKKSIELCSLKDAFVINDTHYTYGQFGQYISNVKSLIRDIPIKKNEIIGVVTYNDIETYATIYALWFSGLCFLPINPLFPEKRNQEIIRNSNLRYVFYSKSNIDINDKVVQSYSTLDLPNVEVDLDLPTLSDEDLMYILFTSGSTGIPKGVPINRKNLNGFVDAFFSNGYSLSSDDRFLQMFDFTFDVSVQCYVLPLCIGASVYTVPLDNIKFFAIYQILEKYKITVAKMVPSVIAFLRPYFSKIKLPYLKYSLFSGEALFNDVVEKWADCVPNAIIQNYYGPTEATIDCLYYTWSRSAVPEKIYNGVISIGRPFGDTKALIIGEDGQIITDDNLKGELCVSGNQVTTGYLNLPDKNKSAFVQLQFQNENCTFYRTGDLVYRDKDGDYLYCGRIDQQVQIQGYRVELGELESHTKQLIGNVQVAAVAKTNASGNVQLFLFVENYQAETKLIIEYLQKTLPHYMVPSKVIVLEAFPLSSSGKIDRKKLIEFI